MKTSDDQVYQKREDRDRLNEEIVKIFGEIDTLRDPQGNILLYQEPGKSSLINEERYRQYLSVNFVRNSYNFEEAQKALDFEIVELYKKKPSELLNEFFQLYDQLLLLIPTVGPDNSHKTIIEESSIELGREYLDPDEFGSLNERLQSSIENLDELIESLRVSLENNEDLSVTTETIRKQIDVLSGLINLLTNNSENLSIEELVDFIISELESADTDTEEGEDGTNTDDESSDEPQIVTRRPITIDVKSRFVVSSNERFGQQFPIDITFSILDSSGDVVVSGTRRTPFALRNVPVGGQLSLGTTVAEFFGWYVNGSLVSNNTNSSIFIQDDTSEIVAGIEV